MSDESNELKNPFESPHADGAKSKRRFRSPLYPLTLFPLGSALVYFSYLGMTQLRQLASPNSVITDLNEVPIVKFFWEIFADGSGTSKPSDVAGDIQFSLLVTGAIGVLILLFAFITLIRFMIVKTRSA